VSDFTNKVTPKKDDTFGMILSIIEGQLACFGHIFLIPECFKNQK
jgi:hypothetical protein